MAWVAVAAGTVSLGSAAYKGIAGAKQVKKGKMLDKNNVRPTYERPGEVTQALDLTERNYRNGMPGMDLAENRIGSNAATAFNAVNNGATSSSDLLDGATKINMNTNNAVNDLNLQSQNFKAGAMNDYIAQLMASGNYGDKEFEYNQNQPFQETAAKAAALIGAGNQNINTAVGEVGGIANSVLMGSLSGGLPTNQDRSTTAVQTNMTPITKTPRLTSAVNNTPISGLGVDGRKLIYDPSTKTMRYL